MIREAGDEPVERLRLVAAFDPFLPLWARNTSPDPKTVFAAKRQYLRPADVEPYRIYALDDGEQIRLADWIQAEDDAEAIEKARRLEHGALRCEIWLRNRLVASLGSEDLA